VRAELDAGQPVARRVVQAPSQSRSVIPWSRLGSPCFSPNQPPISKCKEYLTLHDPVSVLRSLLRSPHSPEAYCMPLIKHYLAMYPRRLLSISYQNPTLPRNYVPSPMLFLGTSSTFPTCARGYTFPAPIRGGDVSTHVESIDYFEKGVSFCGRFDPSRRGVRRQPTLTAALA
jgi:hypothetical protein